MGLYLTYTAVYSKFYRDSSLNQEVIMSHLLSSETCIPVSLLMGSQETPEIISVQVRWKVLSHYEDTI